MVIDRLIASWRAATIIVIGALCGSAALWWTLSGAPHAAKTRPLMPLDFPHKAHVAFNCVTCHHNYTEARLSSWPFQGCIACHKNTPSLSGVIEEQFHGQCESCHLKFAEEHRKSGPPRACHVCHVAGGMTHF
ncbi:cytochrome c3 family protein [Acetobacter nitrogenifigens]|uniref:Class III cytochrome C domain-containing protein n=1 Tax=Acetobacter nitrogenifigens DSM 23921 = NBRC 105050 TaxID=1120919 RepID=A0A511XEC9_9PROT|nr:cytochrome c3 family protein [Acetobacter nitrogenifigens]GEN61241.1 hypothetical protein ANI02nite_31250 [Acetobacter nitrogenifigens DSM 23921 = NBRC 105050]